MMLFIQLAVVLLFIFLGARKGRTASGVPASSSWVTRRKVDPGTGPWDVVGVIICSDFLRGVGSRPSAKLLVMLSERILRHNQKVIFLAPTVTFFADRVVVPDMSHSPSSRHCEVAKER